METVKDSNDVEQIQKLLREAARVYSNLHSHACKAGVEIPVEARLSLYGNDFSWSDDLIGAGVDITAWQEDGFVLVDAFPDVKEDMDIEFEKAIQEAVKNISTLQTCFCTRFSIALTGKNETTKVPIAQGVGFSGGGFEDPFQDTTATSGFAAFDAFPSVSAQPPAAVSPVPAASPVPAFAVSFDAPVSQTQGQTVTAPFTAFPDLAVAAKTEAPATEGFEASFPDFTAATIPTPQTTGASVRSAKETNPSGDPFGDSAFA